MISALDRCDLRLVDRRWVFEVENAARIDAFWAEAVAKNPALWDGRVLIAQSVSFADGLLSAELLEVRFASFLAWRDWDYEDKGAYSVFGSAIVRSSDGAVIFGVMRPDTASPGLIYPCAGMLEPRDVDAGGAVDAFGSAVSELAEETGLDAADAVSGADFVTMRGQLVSVSRVFTFDMAGAELAERIRSNIAAQSVPELSDVALMRGRAEIDRKLTKPYAIEIAEHLLAD